MTSLEGQTFAGYEILAKLGQGGMGAVYKARQPHLDRLAALKIMASELATDPDFVARFRREAAAAANLSHPNIVQVYSAGESEGTHYIAMEFVDGETVKQHIESQGRLDPREAIAITVFVAEALQYGWNKAKLVHRDIKPENIFLSQSGEVKVGDLGLAKIVGGGTTSLTQTGMMMGSPHYISPEQARGVSDIDFHTDIYSLGCTLYHMLTGRPPYEGPDPLSVITKHVNDPPPAIFKSWPGCPVPLALVLGKMLAKRPHERPASYEDLIEQLREVHAKLKPTTLPVSAGAPTPAQPTPKPVVAKTATPRPAPTAKPKGGSRALLYAAAGIAALAVVAGAVWWFASRAPADGFKSLFNGKDLAGWKVREGNPPNSWIVRDGALMNTEPKTYLVSEETFGDFEFHCEYRLDAEGDGGVYLRGLYQVQLLPDVGRPPSRGSTGAIHELIAPSENAARGAGEWQTLDARLVGRKVTVTINGRRVIEDIEATRATRISLNLPLDAPGPIMLQGHLGTCEYRNLRIKPLGTSSSATPSTTLQPLQTIDLLALTDPVKDRIKVERGASHSKANAWERRGSALAYASDGGSGKLAPAVAINARSYEIEVEFERLSGEGRFHMDLPLDTKRIVPIVFDNTKLKMINCRAGAPWPVDRGARARVVVRLDRSPNDEQDRIAVRLDGEPVVDWRWQGSANNVAQTGEPHPDFPGQPVTSIYIHKDSYEVRAWQLRIFDGEAKVLREAAATAAAPVEAKPAAGLQYGLYYHFDITTFNNPKDHLRIAKLPLSTYAPKALDVRQWVRVAREAGASFAVLSAKYEAGFLLWPAKDHDYNVGLTPVKTDVVQEFVAACKAEGIKAGVQYSVPDAHIEGRINRNGPVSAEYFQTIKNHLAELTANYPDILIYKLYFAERLSPAQLSELTELLKQSNPNRIILQTYLGSRDRPGIQEHNVATVNEGWIWSPNCKLTPTPKLLQKYQESVQQNRPLLLNVGPDRDGRISDEFVAALTALKGMMGIPVQPAPAADAGWQNAINLLPLIDPQKDAVGGQWTWSGNTLVSDSAQNGRIAIPYRPPQEYDYRLVFHHTKGYTPADAGQVIQILSKDGRLFSWIMGAKKGDFIGFETVAGANSADRANPTISQRKPALKKNVTYTSLVEVRNDGLKAYLNGELVAQYKTDYKDMGIIPHWKLPDPTLLGVGSWLTAMVIEKLEVREVTGKGTFTRGASIGEWTTLPNGWRIGKPVNLGPIVNSASDDGHPTVSGDGLTLLFNSNRVGGNGRIWACTRRSTTDTWGAPRDVEDVNTSSYTGDPCLSPDGLTLFFGSTRPRGGQGKGDLWMCSRRSTAERWSGHENLGPVINSGYNDGSPFLSADGLTLLFNSDRPGGLGSYDLWMSTRPQIGAAWSAPLNLGPPVNGKHEESNPCLSADGLALFFTSDRDGGQGRRDLWMSTRRSKAQPFTEPINLGAKVNTTSEDSGAWLSTDNCTLYFHSDRPGGLGRQDLWQVAVLPPDTSSNTPTLQRSNLPAALSAFCAEVAVLPAEQQVARVVAKLKELNPGYDGKEEHRIEDGQVLELRFSTEAISDISPVRALKNMRTLECVGSRTKPTLLSDLSPLHGLTLTGFRCARNLVSDLTPLRGMALEILDVGFTQVNDLSQLKGMPLRQLMCQSTKVTDLSPLRDMSLTHLYIAGTGVEDITPLKGMPLAFLHIDHTKVRALSLLSDMPLKYLRCDFKPERDNEVLRSIKTLKTINDLPAAEFWKKVEAGEVPKP